MTTIEYLKREIHRTELSIRQAHRKPNTPFEEIEGLCEKLKHMQEALKAVEEHWQRVHEQRGWTAGEPLTLEQLRGAPHGKIRDKTLQHICVRANELAQAHSPAAHIDREAWTAEWVKHGGYTECSKCEHWYDSPESEDDGDRPRFCPECGRAMTPEAWAEMERRVFGEV